MIRRTLSLGVALAGWFAPCLVAQDRGVTIEGLVVDSATHTPVERADVYVLNGPRVSTDRNGRFQLRRVKPDQKFLLVRRIGYAPRATRLTLYGHEGTTLDLGTVRVTALAQMLDSIAIQARVVAQNPRMDDFFRRRRSGRGVYLTRQQIFDMNVMFTSDIMHRIPGTTTQCSTGLGAVCVAASTRGGGCPLTIIVDGAVGAGATTIGPDGITTVPLTLDDIPAAWIAGIEVYKGFANIPLELTGGISYPCGVIAIWTGVDDR